MKSKYTIVFAGGGTGGHIYPGIAVADQLRIIAKRENIDLDIFWIGNSTGMDRGIVENNLVSKGGSITSFYGIPSGKLRRYFSLKNFTDLFKIGAGVIRSFFILAKLHPDVLFSKGGFVSVTPCMAASFLRIPYFTHECDFTPGLATRLNSKKAFRILVSYEQTKQYLGKNLAQKAIVTGNPVRPVFFEDNGQKGLEFLGIKEKIKPVLLVLGGSLGALQINSLVEQNLEKIKEKFIVVHQTGSKYAEENPDIMNHSDDSYKPYAFIHSEMPSVVHSADVILSRAGANSLWECGACSKPMVLIPLCGSGTRGDQVDNARYFESKGAAIVLAGDEANSDNLLTALDKMSDKKTREDYSLACGKIASSLKSHEEIAKIVFEKMKG